MITVDSVFGQECFWFFSNFASSFSPTSKYEWVSFPQISPRIIFFPRKTNCLTTHHPLSREGWGLSKISPPTGLDLEFQGRRDSHWLNHEPPVDISVHKCHELPSPNVPIFISQNIKLAIDWPNIWYRGTVLFAFLIWIKSSCVCVHVCSRILHLSLFRFKSDRRLCPQMSGWAISVS